MATLPIGIATRALGLPLRRALAVAAELGADGVEIDLRNELRRAEFSQTALRQFRKLLEDHRLKVLSVTFPTRRGLADPNELERRLLALREAMTFAYKIGSRVVVTRPGPVTEDEGSISTALVDSLTLLGAHGEHCGARLAIASGAAATDQAALLDLVGEGVVGAALQPALLLGEGGEPHEAASALGPQVTHLYGLDAVREPSGGGTTETALGRGEADLPAVLATLEEHDYRGAITVGRVGAPDPMAEIGDAIAFIRAL